MADRNDPLIQIRSKKTLGSHYLTLDFDQSMDFVKLSWCRIWLGLYLSENRCLVYIKVQVVHRHGVCRVYI